MKLPWNVSTVFQKTTTKIQSFTTDGMILCNPQNSEGSESGIIKILPYP